MVIAYYFTGKAVSNTELNADKIYSHTRAICNLHNECLDVIIYCEDGRVTDIEPISDIVQQELNWSDPRGNLTDNLC